MPLPVPQVFVPAHALIGHTVRRGLCAHALRRVVGAVRLTEGVTACDEGHGLFVVHGHPAERLADVGRGGQRVRVAVRALGVHVDEAHLHRSERILELPVAVVALIGEHLGLGAPVHELRLPVVDPAAGETHRLEAHLLHRHGAREDHQVGPGQAATVLLLHRPEEAPRLVEVGVVGPAVQRLEPLLPAVRAAATIGDAIGARAVPGHAHEERAVVAEVGGPPVLRRGHHPFDVRLDGGEVERLEGGGVVEVSRGIGIGRILAKRREVHAVRPPELVGLGFARARVGLRRGRCLARRSRSLGLAGCGQADGQDRGGQSHGERLHRMHGIPRCRATPLRSW